VQTAEKIYFKTLF